MANNAFNIKLTPESKLKLKRLAKVGKSIDLTRAFFLIGIAYRKEVRAIFERKQARPNVNKWDKLKDSTIKSRVLGGYGESPMLVNTGRLKNSMISDSHSENISKMSPLSGVFGSTVPYGKYIDEGTIFMKARDIITPSVNSHKTYLKILEAEIDNLFRLAGFR